MSRTITIYSQATNQTKEITTSATTWGQIKAEVSKAINAPLETVKAIVRETRNTLDNDDAKLPEGAFTIFLLPVKVKSGGRLPLKKKTTVKKVKKPAKKVGKSKPIKKVKKLTAARLKKEAALLKSQYNGELVRCR